MNPPEFYQMNATGYAVKGYTMWAAGNEGAYNGISAKFETTKFMNTEAEEVKDLTVGILYISTGRYRVFWPTFYNSVQRNFLPDCKRKYFIFSDSPLSYFTDSVHVEDKSSIVYTYIENKPWPYITLLRYHLFVDYYHLWKDCDYTFFINGNYCFYQHVGRDILPTPEESGLVVAEHQKSLDLHPRDYPYERNPRSTAYIPVGEGTHYYAGGLNGGITEEFYKLSLEIRDTTQKDLDNEIIAVWHDESQLNARLLHRTVKILSPWYVWPSYSKKRSIRKQIIAGTLDKNNYGGYDWLRGATDKKRKPKWRRRLERYLIIAVSVIAIIAAAYFIWQQC